jgi:hypothetical protein
MKSGKDVRVSERRGADAGAAVMAATEWANPSLSAILFLLYGRRQISVGASTLSKVKR